MYIHYHKYKQVNKVLGEHELKVSEQELHSPPPARIRVNDVRRNPSAPPHNESLVWTSVPIGCEL